MFAPYVIEGEKGLHHPGSCRAYLIVFICVLAQFDPRISHHVFLLVTVDLFQHVVSEPINLCNCVSNHQQHPRAIRALAAVVAVTPDRSHIRSSSPPITQARASTSKPSWSTRVSGRGGAIRGVV